MRSSFFALQSVHQYASYELSHSTIRWFSKCQAKQFLNFSFLETAIQCSNVYWQWVRVRVRVRVSDHSSIPRLPPCRSRWRGRGRSAAWSRRSGPEHNHSVNDIVFSVAISDKLFLQFFLREGFQKKTRQIIHFLWISVLPPPLIHIGRG